MSDIKRKLASIQRVDKIRPIPGADNIVCATVLGWDLVTQKTNFKEGDLCVFFEVDSFLPVREEFEFLRKGCFKSTKNLGDGFRLRTIKLRGQISQGLILPLTAFEKFFSIGDQLLVSTETFEPIPIEPGQDLTDYLKVQKYEKPIPAQLQGRIRGNFPMFIPKTDQERAQNLVEKLRYKLADRFESTLKLDGSSMTVYFNNNDIGVCSRNLDLKDEDDNTFWKVAKEEGLIDTLVKGGRNLALQGELMGPGVQGNRENLSKHVFYLFDIYDIDEKRYFTPDERYAFIQINPNIKHAPVLEYLELSFVCKPDTIIPDLLKYTERRSINHEIAEGVVFKSLDGKFSFKIINNQFLLKED